MLVYGDPHFDESARVLTVQLRTRVLALRQKSEPSLDELRALLILAGQLEQAICDLAPSLLAEAEACSFAWKFQAVTDCAATAFLACWAAMQNDISFSLPEVTNTLAAMTHALDELPATDARLTVKLPEGFAFYALFPEQYCAAALRWMADHTDSVSEAVIVVGVRSIGTTLSALINATLLAGGWHSHRVTVRPFGHPFERQAEIAAFEIGDANCCLVVDEGPGLSGSSMAAVAQAAHRVGIARERISFSPGHGGHPGEKASASTRAWWNTAPRYVTPLEELRWNGRALSQVLADATLQLCDTNGQIERIEDLSGGAWRQFVFSDSSLWPAVAAPFERTKIRITLRGGKTVLWKFSGLAVAGSGEDSATETLQRQLAIRAADGWTPQPLGISCGFLATRWIEGEPLVRTDATPALVLHIGHYIAAVAAASLSHSEQQVAIERLQEMLRCNTREAFGEITVARTEKYSEAALRWALETSSRSYGDGHMAPHEWIRTRGNEIVKVDSLGHDADHTMLGKQSLAWDVAGVLIEWQANEICTASLLDALQKAGIATIPADALHFYQLAYAAFRLGLFTQCAAMNSDGSEAVRLKKACTFYCEQLAQLLANQ